ncbi:MAG: hypothetical protein DRN66_04280 [Candidatus Nanohalarchaeota archaeon]|nr:MAG: hypothetical protein DRN66_04280 [Candidatus Nanohaloarchaeota archaeon]
MELDFYAFRQLFENTEFFNIVLPLLFFTTMFFAVIEFVTKKSEGKLPFTPKTNIVISLIFGFLATNNEEAVRFLLDNFKWVILLMALAYVYLILQKIAPNIDYLPILVMLGVVVLMLNESILAKYEADNWIFALLLFFAIFWAVYKSKD